MRMQKISIVLEYKTNYVVIGICKESIYQALKKDAACKKPGLPYSGLFSKQKFSHKKQNLNFERF